MRYYAIKIMTATNGTEVRDLRGFDTLDEALMLYYSNLQTAIGKCKSVYYAVDDRVGGVYKSDTWSAAAVQAEE